MKSETPNLDYLLPMIVAVSLIGIGLLSLVLDGAQIDGSALLRHVLLFCVPFTLLGVATAVLAWLRLVSSGYLAASAMLFSCSIRFLSDAADQFLGGPTRVELPVYISIGVVTIVAAGLLLLTGRRVQIRKQDLTTEK